jgi:hypothetical protein
VSGPCQKRIPLCYHPVQSSVKMNDNHGSDRRLCRDQSGIRCRRSHSLVDEWDSKECSSERSEEREGRHGLLNGISPSRAKMYQDHPTFSGLPLKPTNVPLRVYKFWEAEMDAERRENGLLSTSKRASTHLSQRCVYFVVYRQIYPTSARARVATAIGRVECLCRLGGGRSCADLNVAATGAIKERLP